MRKSQKIDIRTKSVLRRSLFERMFRRANKDARKALSISLYELIAKSSFEEESLGEIIRIALTTLRGNFSVRIYMNHFEDMCIDQYMEYFIKDGELATKNTSCLPAIFKHLNLFQSSEHNGIYWDERKNVMYKFNLIPSDFNIVKSDTVDMLFHQPMGIITPMIFQKRSLGLIEMSGNYISFNSDKEPFNLLLYSASIARIIAMHIELQSDPLTSLKTRRRYDMELPLKISYAMNCKIPLSLIYIDADHFKSVNDKYGHNAGDSLLRYMAKQFLNSIRSSECEVFRIGGEEFAIITYADIKESSIIAKRISEGINKGINVRDNNGNMHLIKPTISIGIAALDVELAENHETDVHQLSEMLKRHADSALYTAKNEYGRDCIVVREKCDDSIHLRKI